MNRTLTLALTVVVSLIGSRAAAQTLQVPNTFQAGTPARAAEVNQNFDAVAGAVNANSVDMAALVQRLETLESQVADLEARLADAEDNTVLKLNGYLDLDDHDPAKPVAILAGVNLQVINGLGNTNTINGLGNLIIGYDEDFARSIWDEQMKICSLGTYTNQTDCEANGQVWSAEHKSGSHYLIVGEGHRYSQYGGLVAGRFNTVNGMYSTVTGGEDNTASRRGSSAPRSIPLGRRSRSRSLRPRRHGRKPSP